MMIISSIIGIIQIETRIEKILKKAGVNI